MSYEGRSVFEALTAEVVAMAEGPLNEFTLRFAGAAGEELLVSLAPSARDRLLADMRLLEQLLAALRRVETTGNEPTLTMASNGGLFGG